MLPGSRRGLEPGAGIRLQSLLKPWLQRGRDAGTTVTGRNIRCLFLFMAFSLMVFWNHRMSLIVLVISGKSQLLSMFPPFVKSALMIFCLFWTCCKFRSCVFATKSNYKTDQDDECSSLYRIFELTSWSKPILTWSDDKSFLIVFCRLQY